MFFAEIRGGRGVRHGCQPGLASASRTQDSGGPCIEDGQFAGHGCKRRNETNREACGCGGGVVLLRVNECVWVWVCQQTEFNDLASTRGCSHSLEIVNAARRFVQCNLDAVGLLKNSVSICMYLSECTKQRQKKRGGEEELKQKTWAYISHPLRQVWQQGKPINTAAAVAASGQNDNKGTMKMMMSTNTNKRQSLVAWLTCLGTAIVASPFVFVLFVW